MYYKTYDNKKVFYAEIAIRIQAQYPHLVGAHIFKQLDALGMREEFDSAHTCCSLPYSFTGSIEKFKGSLIVLFSHEQITPRLFILSFQMKFRKLLKIEEHEWGCVISLPDASASPKRFEIVNKFINKFKYINERI